MLAVAWVHDVGGSLRQTMFMFWITLWPLILGFSLLGLVQAYAPRERIQRALGDHRPGAVLRAAGLGAASSSCSYAATAMARALYARGADFVTALIFMFASTNLVIELGIVLAVLMGWQFAVAEVGGGVLMIAGLALTGGWVVARMAPARSAPSPASEPPSEASGADPDRRWVAAAGYAVADLRMLWRELLIGYLVAGFLAQLVPAHAWNDLFVHGHGGWTSLENVAVGPLVAIVSCVCSIGNVPLAAALRKGGISFGGVVSFIFADLVTFPILLIYRRYYGTRMALRLLVWFWLLMSAAGLVVEVGARAAGLIPAHHPTSVVSAHFRWDYTAYLNVAFLLVLVVGVWLYRHADRFGTGAGYAIDPICGMQVRTADAPARATGAGPDHNTYWFCSDRCRDRFVRDAPATSQSQQESRHPHAPQR